MKQRLYQKAAAMVCLAVICLSACTSQSVTTSETSLLSTTDDVLPEAASDSSDESSEEESEKMLVQNILEETDFQGSVYVSYGNQVLYSGGNGLADDETENEPDTIFQIASDTKQFTAAAVLLLQKDGTLSIDDPLTTFFPNMTMEKNLLSKICYQCVREFLIIWDIRTETAIILL